MMRVITEQLPGATLVAIRQHGTAPAEFGREVVLRRTDGSDLEAAGERYSCYF